ncbi:hypothetical protein CONPUDRAFT_152287 [Coniophora puteana RWD-64-598 SS2]|uniref:F-box domain-containing protein n=1 Tax=Coniophora puteana (strain RWD-64-598) TaxID=741705 RepID=A0A5M3MW23_CONPW|nr:uncharacterized protein CONPUDRAFT_152287 [Coniophora puteana RWD-64-598 SS2]EIW83260.1 hypothetical protein CONPUDRAFT_152287 [Coniophora puteana RWD-64-598 SS2]
MPFALDTLPLDVLISVATLLDPPDVVHLRRTSSRLRNLSYERVIWVALYKAYRLALPIGPLPTQTRQVLKERLLRSYSTHQNLFVAPKEPRSRLYDTGDKVHFEVTGRWAFSKDPEGTRVLCYDLDSMHHDAREPSTVWVNDEDEYCIWNTLCRTVTLRDGRQFSLVLLELRRKDLIKNAMYGFYPSPGCKRDSKSMFSTKLVVLKVKSTESSGGALALEELYRHEHVIYDSPSRLLVELSPSALVVQWAGDPEEAFVWDTEKLDSKPVTITHGHASFSKFVLHTCSKTHIISRRSSTDILGTVIEATPLQTVFTDSALRPTAVANMPGTMFNRLAVFRDSIVDPITGSTETVLLGIEKPGPRNNDKPCILLVRLLIPSASEIDGTRRPVDIDVHLQTIATIPLESQTMHLNPAWNGRVRLAYLRDVHTSTEDEASNLAVANVGSDKERRQLSIVEITYDGVARSATMCAVEKVSLPDSARDVFNHRRMRFVSFEAELGSGRLVYSCPLGDYRSPLGKLGVLDFA